MSGSDLGIFKQSTDDEFDWTITNVESPTAGTGPTEDHTGNGGFYVFLDVPFRLPYKFQGYRVGAAIDFCVSQYQSICLFVGPFDCSFCNPFACKTGDHYCRLYWKVWISSLHLVALCLSGIISMNLLRDILRWEY